MPFSGSFQGEKTWQNEDAEVLLFFDREVVYNTICWNMLTRKRHLLCLNIVIGDEPIIVSDEAEDYLA